MIQKQIQILKLLIRKLFDKLASVSGSSTAAWVRIPLCCFLIAAAAASSYLLVTGVSGKKVHIWNFHSPFPVLSNPKQVEPKQSRGNAISQDLLDRILSLKENDSLLRARPGLADTIDLIEENYSPSIKK